MRWIKFFVVLLSATAVSGLASADRHGHASVGIVVGYPWGWPYYPHYPPSYYYPYAYPGYPPTVVVQSPPVYVEQGNVVAAPAQAPSYWYYCNDPQGYYPYVKECPTGWQKVEPQPPALPTLPPPNQ